jgi:tetratricopeptide (TPR) repeat protein
VEAFIQTGRRNIPAAREAYERAHELELESARLNYLYGSFLVDEGIDVNLGLGLLQKSLRAKEASPAVINQISWAHIQLQDYESALTSSMHTLDLRPDYADGSTALAIGLRAAIYGIHKNNEDAHSDAAIELLERAVEFVEKGTVEMLVGEPSDRVLQLVELSDNLRGRAENDYMASSCENFSARLRDRLRAVDSGLLDRCVGFVKNVVEDRAFGFVTYWRRDYFFHLTDLQDEKEWPYLDSGCPVAFAPDEENERGPRAADLRWLG